MDLGLAKGPHSAPGIFFELIHESDNSQHVHFLHHLIPVQRQERFKVLVADAGVPEGDAAKSFQREPFDELVVVLVVLRGEVVNHFWTSLAEDIGLTGADLPNDY